MAVRVDDTVFLDSSLVAWGVPETVRQALAAKGFTTMSLIAHALPSSDHLESFVDLVLGRPEGLAPDAPLLSPEASALRRVVKECSAVVSGTSSLSGIPSSALTVPKPKLCAGDVTKMVTDFTAKYPSEFLRAQLVSADSCQGGPRCSELGLDSLEVPHDGA